MSLEFYSLFFQLVAGLLPLYILYIKKQSFNIEFLVYLASSSLATLIFIITSMLKSNDLWVFNSYLILSIISLSIYYFRINKNKLNKVLSLTFGILCLLILLFELTQTSLVSYSLIYKRICFILFSVVYFIDSIQSESNHFSKTHSIINLSIFLYSAFSYLMVFLIVQFMNYDLWFIHNIAEGISKLLIAYGFWRLSRPSHF